MKRFIIGLSVVMMAMSVVMMPVVAFAQPEISPYSVDYVDGYISKSGTTVTYWCTGTFVSPENKPYIYIRLEKKVNGTWTQVDSKDGYGSSSCTLLTVKDTYTGVKGGEYRMYFKCAGSKTKTGYSTSITL